MGGARVGCRGWVLTWGHAPQHGGTPLYYAARDGRFAMVELLLAMGADKDAATKVREGRGGNVGCSRGV